MDLYTQRKQRTYEVSSSQSEHANNGVLTKYLLVTKII